MELKLQILQFCSHSVDEKDFSLVKFFIASNFSLSEVGGASERHPLAAPALLDHFRSRQCRPRGIPRRRQGRSWRSSRSGGRQVSLADHRQHRPQAQHQDWGNQLHRGLIRPSVSSQITYCEFVNCQNAKLLQL